MSQLDLQVKREVSSFRKMAIGSWQTRPEIRFIDGYHASVLSKTVREMLENPFERFDDLEAIAADGVEISAAEPA